MTINRGSIVIYIRGKRNVKRKVRNEYVLQVMVYGSETWALKKAHVELYCQSHSAKWSASASPKRNTWIRHQTGVNDIIDVIKTGIHGWAGQYFRTYSTVGTV